MIIEIPRKDPYVSEIVDYFDNRLLDCNSNIEEAWASLTPSELKVIDCELAKVQEPDPDSLRYYLENYHVIATKGEDWEPPEERTLWPFWESQEILWEDLEYCWSQGMPVFWLLLKARQVGWSTLIQALCFARTIFNRLTNTLILADEKVRSNHIFEMSHLALERLPWWLCPEIANDIFGELLKFDRKDKKERAIRPGLRSHFFVDAANKLTGSSRGFTLQNVHITEPNLFNNVKVLTRHVFPAITKNNPLTIAAIEGTAEGRNNFYHRLYKEAEKKGTHLKWRAKFVGWWQQKSYSKPFKTPEHKEGFQLRGVETHIFNKVLHEFGKEITKEQFHWRRQESADFEAAEGDAEGFEQEYPSYPDAAFQLQGLTAFPKRTLKLVEVRDVRSPIWFGDIKLVQRRNGKTVPKLIRYQDKHDAPLWLWETARPGVTYYLGGDPGHGVPGKDYSAASIWAAPDVLSKGGVHQPMRQVGEWMGYRGARKFAATVVALGYLFNTCELSIEYNLPTVIDELISVHEYEQLYRWRHLDKIKNRYTNYYGWVTNHKSRDALIDRFRDFMVDESIEIRSQRLLDECFTFVDDGTGNRFDPVGDNAHDDVLFAAMISVFCLKTVMPLVTPAGTEETAVEVDPNADYYNTDYSILHDKQTDDTYANDYAML